MKYLRVRFNSYLNKYLLVLFGVWFFVGMGGLGVLEWFFFFSCLYIIKILPTVLQELKYE